MRKATLLTTIIFILSFAAQGLCWDYYVDAVNGLDLVPDKIGIGWGTSPDNAFRTITKALSARYLPSHPDMPPPNIYVAPGVYNMELGEVFPLVLSTSLIGTNPLNTIIDAGGSGETAVICPYDSYVDSFTITGGSASGYDFENRGGGIFIEYGNYTYIKNCIIKGNKAFSGGGIYTSEGIHIDDCVITDNYAESFGGGIYISNNYWIEDYPTSWIKSSKFDNNSAGIAGAGIYCDSNSPLITDCEITNNSVPDSQNYETYGAGICCRNGSRIFINRCKIKSNIAYDFGGGIFFSESRASIYNSQISDNTAVIHRGGGLYSDSGIVEIFNCLITVNSAREKGAGVFAGRYSSVDIGNCTISDNFSSTAAAIYNNSGSTLNLYNCIVWNCGDVPIESDGYGNINKFESFDTDPGFITGPRGEYYLSQVMAGQEYDSPFLDKGYRMEYLAYPDYASLSHTTTSTDGTLDLGSQKRYDAGYHYPSHIYFSLHLEPYDNYYSYYEPVDLLLDLDKVGPVREIDIYFVMIDEEGNIYSAPKWGKGLSPYVTNVMLPENMKFDDMIIRRLNAFDRTSEAFKSPPYDPGPQVTYTYAIAATIAGTTELISNFETIEFTTTLRP
ncbi:right-handed parallel beta-helix repeat-containing protein [bacterium]|nr:right-handed parallel beta-helix repeat-containing protein [bacterium]